MELGGISPAPYDRRDDRAMTSIQPACTRRTSVNACRDGEEVMLLSQPMTLVLIVAQRFELNLSVRPRGRDPLVPGRRSRTKEKESSCGDLSDCGSSARL